LLLAAARDRVAVGADHHIMLLLLLLIWLVNG
jgi:hypothetical protein